MGISRTSVKNTLGVSTFKTSELCGHSNVNLWSFYSPLTYNVNPASKEVQRSGNTNKIGDFRSYNHSANTPRLFTTSFNTKYTPGASSVTFDLLIYHYEFNYLALGLNVSDIVVKVYSNSARTNLVTTRQTAITYSTVSPPSGHTKNQTRKPTSSQLVSGITINNPSLYSTLYYDVWLATSAGVLICHYGTWQGSGTVSQYQNPILKATKLILSGNLPSGNSPAGQPWSTTGSRLQLYTAATPKDSSSTVPQSPGTSYSFYWTVVLMDQWGNDYCAGISSIRLKTYRDDGSQSYDQTIESNTNNTDPTTQRLENGNLSSGQFSYDEQWEVYYDTTYGITYNGVYSAI